MPTLQYPRRWKNKQSGQELKVMPWWETVDGDGPAKVDELGELVTEVAGQPCKFGVIVQIGYLLENEHGLWFGIGPKGAEHFDDLGEWKKKRKRK